MIASLIDIMVMHTAIPLREASLYVLWSAQHAVMYRPIGAVS